LNNLIILLKDVKKWGMGGYLERFTSNLHEKDQDGQQELHAAVRSEM
jgi:predicted AlkP superfamily phosphohydrolase/phosphomutase